MSTVRKFSMVGPCIVQGELVTETRCFFVFKCKRTGDVRRLKKDAGGLNHIEPCPSCMDHPETQYPNRYEN